MSTPDIFNDIEEKGYIIFSIEKSKLSNYYPGSFGSYPGVRIKELKIYDLITIKIFITNASSDFPNLIDDYIDLTINSIQDGRVIAQVLTLLPENFQEEILHRNKVTDH